MSETVNSTPDALEALVSEYETGVAEHETNDPKTWFAVRDQIETHYDELTEEQASRVEDADSDLVEHAGDVAARLAATPGESLRDLRKGSARPPEQWWWYLDVLSHVSDHYESGGKTESSTASRLLTIVELIVLAVAIVLLAIRFLPQLQGSATPTVFPTFTPAPTSTPDPSSFDLSTATTFKAPNDVVEILLPKAWKNNDLSNPAMYSFVLGDPQNPTVEIRVWIDTLANLFGGQSGATPPTTPQDALKSISDNFKQSAPAASGASFSDVTPSTIGKLSAFVFSYSIPDSAQGPGATGEFRAAQLPGNKVVLVRIQGTAAALKQGLDVLHKMVDSLVVNPTAIPTSTPTSTAIPLELTLTAIADQANAVQTQISALTPTSTPLPTSQATGTPAAPSAGTAAAPAPTAAQ